MKKGVLLAALVVALNTSGVAFANPNNGDIDIDKVLTEITNIESNVQKLNTDIYKIEDSINKVKVEISALENEIKKNEEKIKEKEKDIKKQATVIKETAKKAYINNSDGIKECLQVLFDAGSISEFAQRFFMIKDMMSQNKAKLNVFNNDKNLLEQYKSELDDKKDELNSSIEELKNKEAELNDKKINQEQKLEDYTKIKEQYYEELEVKEAEMRAQYTETVSEINNNENIVSETIVNETIVNESVASSVVESNNSSSLVTESLGSSVGANIVSIAYKYLGVPYVWGGTTPSGFDCSGFVQYVYREAGISLSRTTYTQIAEGYAVSSLEPGDLVFFGSYSDPYHVGIYVGNGQYVHAPTTGDVVKVASLDYRNDYCGARRYY